MFSFEIDTVDSYALPAALGIAFASFSETERRSQIECVLNQYGGEQIKSGIPGIFVAKWKNRKYPEICGAVCTQFRPDGTLLIWSAGIAPDFSRNLSQAAGIRKALYEEVDRYAREISAKILILFTENRDSELERELEELKFENLTDLLQLVAQENVFPMECGRNSLRFIPYSGEMLRIGEEKAFCEMVNLLESTYENTRDFPRLTGIVPTESILNGYKSEGEYRPDLWFFVRCEEKNIGSLILTDRIVEHQLNLTYMGIVPEERRKGFGPQIVQFVLWKARQLRRNWVLVSVDAKNPGAFRSYQKNGFQIWNRKTLFVRFLHDKNP